jgi:hypothetical protein
VVFRYYLNVNRPAIFERKIQTSEQGREVVFGVPNDKGALAAAELSEAVLH